MVRLTIHGEPASKANSRRLVTGKRFIKSQKALVYEQDAQAQIPDSARVMFECDVGIKIKIYYCTRRPDLDESLILDVLQAKTKGSGKERVVLRRGVYLNDRQVREKHIYHGIDKYAPRAEIEVWKL